MGMYDTFDVDDCDGQVKIYDSVMSTFHEGIVLPDLQLPYEIEYPPEDYGIKLRHGGWIIVKNKVFFKYQEDKPDLAYLYDKWGREWGEDNYE